MTIKGLLFDLDGTLLDRDASLLSFVEDQYERLAELHHVEKQQYVEAFLHLDQRGYLRMKVCASQTPQFLSER